MSISPSSSPPKMGSSATNPNLFGDAVRYKISSMRKSTLGGSPTSTRKSSQGSPAWKGKVPTTNKVVNESVSFYVNRCNAHRVEPILEYVVAISDSSTTTCALTDRKRPLTDQDVALISESLRTNTNIRDLDLSGNGIGLGGATELALALKVNLNITKLVLANNDLKSEGVLRIAAALRENKKGSPLQVLDLRSNQIGNHGVAGLSEILVAEESSLEELDLQRNMVKDQGVIAISAALKVNTSLKILNLRFNELTDTGALALGATLRMNKGLTELDVGGNKIGNEGAEAIALGLCSNTTLLKLNLRSNLIGDSGAVSIAEALKRNESLKELFLGSNNIAATGCSAIADAFKENHTLTKVDLQGISMGTSGALAIADALRINTSISHLVMDLEKVGKEEALTIASAIRANPSLTELNIGEDTSGISEEILTAITSTLKLNRYVAGISEETGFSEYFQNRPLSATGKRGTGGRGPSPAPAVSPIPQAAHSMEMNEVLSTMGDKLKNLQQQVKKERESNKSKTHIPTTPQGIPIPQGQPQNPRIISTSSTFVGGEGDGSLGGNSQWEPVSEEALSSSPVKETRDVRYLPPAPSPQPQPLPHPHPHPLPHPYHSPHFPSRPTPHPNALNSHSTPATPYKPPASAAPSQFGQPAFSTVPPTPASTPSQPQFNTSTIPAAQIPSLNNLPSSASQNNITTSSPSTPHQNHVSTTQQSSPIPNHVSSSQPNTPKRGKLTERDKNPSTTTKTQSSPSTPHSSINPSTNPTPVFIPTSNPTNSSTNSAAAPSNLTSASTPIIITTPPTSGTRTSEPELPSFTLPPQMEGWARAIEQKLATQDKAISSLRRTMETKHTALFEEFKSQLMKQEEDFRHMHDQQADVYKLMRGELNKLVDDAKLISGTAVPQGSISIIVTEVLKTDEVRKVQRDADNLRARVAELEPLVSELRQSLALIENDLSKTRAHDTTLAEVKRQLRDMEERISRAGGSSNAPNGIHEAQQRLDDRIRSIERVVSSRVGLGHAQESEAGSSGDGRDTEEDSRDDDGGRGRRVVEKVRGLEGVVRGLEEKVKADGGRIERRMGEMLKRMEMLEEALRNEQETSLKALEAILAE